MASLYIRELDDDLVKAIRVKALQEGITVKAFLLPALERLVSIPKLEIPPDGEGLRVRRKADVKHDPKTCQNYRCGMCAVANSKG